MEVIRNFINLIFHKYFMGHRRKTPAMSLCKSIMSSIQWFQMHHIITFSTIYNKAVGLSGARVSPFHALVPQLSMHLEKKRQQRLNSMQGIATMFLFDMSSYVLVKSYRACSYYYDKYIVSV